MADASDPEGRLRALYADVAPALVRKGTRMLGARADAEDVVQQLFVDLIHRGRADVDLGYLFRAVTNRCLNRMRDRSRRAALLARHGTDLHPTERPRVDDRLVSVDVLLRTIDQLGDRQSEIFALHFVDGIDQGAVGRLLGVDRRTVARHVARIREVVAAVAGDGGAS